MATVLPPPSKRQKLAADQEKLDLTEQAKIPDGLGSVRVQFIDQATGQPTAGAISIPIAQATTKNLEVLLNSIQNQDEESAEKVPYRFTFLSDKQKDGEDAGATRAIDIPASLYHSILNPGLKTTEDLISLHFTPLSVFRIRAVTRCSASISGHGAAILACSFHPASSSRMASGSGDSTARIWDCDTGTPFATLKGHTGWVLAVAYSPDGSLLATGSYDRTVRIWDAATGKPYGATTTTKPAAKETKTARPAKDTTPSGIVLSGHSNYITSLAWEPFHLSTSGRPRLASSSKDGTVRVWDVVRGMTDFVLSGHTSTVSCVRWGGHGGPGGDAGTIYTSSHDKTIKLWSGADGKLLKTLTAHAHWVNHLALSTDHVLRTAYHDPAPNAGLPASASDEAKRAATRARYDKAATIGGALTERLVSASDDNTVFLWDTSSLASSKPLARLLGHGKLVNHVTFSPSGTHIASCGFDNLIKLWRASDGTFIRNCKGHVAPVYQCAFSADGRLLVSASKDATVKCWEVESGRMTASGDLGGHEGEVFAVDWAPDGKRVGSGSRDRTVRIWTN